MGGDSLLVDDVNGGHTPPDSSVEMTDRQKKQLENWKKKQEDFNNGNPIKTGKLTKKDSKIVQTMEEAGVEKVNAGQGLSERDHYNYDTGQYETRKSKGTDVIYVKKLTQTIKVNL